MRQVNQILYYKLHDAKNLINELGEGIQYMDVDTIVQEIKNKWEEKISPQLKRKMSNGLMLSEWGKVMIER